MTRTRPGFTPVQLVVSGEVDDATAPVLTAAWRLLLALLAHDVELARVDLTTAVAAALGCATNTVEHLAREGVRQGVLEQRYVHTRRPSGTRRIAAVRLSKRRNADDPTS